MTMSGYHFFSEVLKKDGRFKHSYNIITVGYWMCDMYKYQVQNLWYVYLFVIRSRGYGMVQSQGEYSMEGQRCDWVLLLLSLALTR
jgi:hypothetical protein